jgi:hypothetical protein
VTWQSSAQSVRQYLGLRLLLLRLAWPQLSERPSLEVLLLLPALATASRLVKTQRSSRRVRLNRRSERKRNSSPKRRHSSAGRKWQ